MSYLGGNELVFNNDLINGIHSGGFSVNSVMIREGISPIMTLNNNQLSEGGVGGGEQVSDIFSNLVIPNWAFSYGKSSGGGIETERKNKNLYKSDDEDEDSDDDVIDDDLHEKLLDLVKEHDLKMKQNKKKQTKKNKNKVLKTTTKKNKV
jgi:hypothetical protein